jgi:hypothetical protein
LRELKTNLTIKTTVFKGLASFAIFGLKEKRIKVKRTTTMLLYKKTSVKEPTRVDHPKLFYYVVVSFFKDFKNKWKAK